MHRLISRAAAMATVAAAGLAGAPDIAAASPLVAAFERYNGDRGFDIGMVKTVTGETVFVPAGVNTAADEFHPALTPDGRYLVFTRTTLSIQPDGDVVPPAARNILMVDRQTGNFSAPFPQRGSEAGAGATIVATSASSSILAYGLRGSANPSSLQRRVIGGGLIPGSAATFQENALVGSTSGEVGFFSEPAGVFADIPHAAVGVRQGRLIKATASYGFSEGTGFITRALTTLVDQSLTSASDNHELRLQTNDFPRHATPRVTDGHIALDTTPPSGLNANIATIQFPGDSTPSAMSAAVNTLEAERMPAWSPDGKELGFIRTTGPAGGAKTRKLLVFDSSLGIQSVVNPAVTIAPEVPTEALRLFQNTWGNLSLARASSVDSVALGCGVCGAGVVSGQATGPGITLRPVIDSAKTQIGIFISRVLGTRRLFSRTVPRVVAVGRVPLGVAGSRRPQFRWNGRVNGRRLAAGTYLLTFRAVTAGSRVLDTSRSIRFTLTAGGNVTGVRPLGL